jgi:hypothetical protein
MSTQKIKPEQIEGDLLTASGIHSATEKTSFAVNDEFVLLDSAASYILKKIKGNYLVDSIISYFSSSGYLPPTTDSMNDFQVGSGTGSWIKKTLAQTVTILRSALDSIYPVTSGGTWTPTLNGITQGNGTVIADYQIHGKLLFLYFRFTFGSTSSVSSSPVYFSFPTTISRLGSAQAIMVEVGNAPYLGHIDYTTTDFYVRITKRDANDYIYSSPDVTSTTPFTWATGDFIQVTLWALLP